MRARLIGCIAAMIGAPALAVSLGPLAKSGITDGSGKAFYLDLRNNETQAQDFRIDALEQDHVTPARRVTVFPSRVTLAANNGRKLFVIVSGLTAGETYSFRVCAYRPPQPTETVLARVCSKLTARRLPAGV